MEENRLAIKYKSWIRKNVAGVVYDSLALCLQWDIYDVLFQEWSHCFLDHELFHLLFRTFIKRIEDVKSQWLDQVGGIVWEKHQDSSNMECLLEIILVLVASISAAHDNYFLICTMILCVNILTTIKIWDKFRECKILSHVHKFNNIWFFNITSEQKCPQYLSSWNNNLS